MGKATIEEYSAVGAGNPKHALGLGVVQPTGLDITQVTTSGTAANTTLKATTVAINILAEDTDIRIDIGSGVTADSGTSRLISSGQSAAFALPIGRIEYRVSIIDAA